MASSNQRPLGKQMLKTASLFQIGVALPVTIILGLICFVDLFGGTRYSDFYEFYRNAINALLAAGIIFLAVINIRVPLSNVHTVWFEFGKSALATILWLWLVLDAFFGPWQYKYPWMNPDDIQSEKISRLQRSFLCLILLFTLFYPTLGYSVYVWKNETEEEEEEAAAAEGDERTPLLQ